MADSILSNKHECFVCGNIYGLDRHHSIRAICKRMGISDATVYAAVNKRKRSAI